jgi:DNA (cytosine-5)-methyltransferase 1
MLLLPNKIRNGEIEAPDLLCGGTPCQAFSVAGLRQSLDDARGNLSLTFCEIADAIDSVRKKPCIVFWENVPGVLNTKDNAFGCFLGALAGEDDALIAPRGRWANAGFIDGSQRAVAWRVLDAQYFGVAQRRRRVFVVASARADFDPAAVLFEFEGLRRDIAPSRKQGEEVAGTIAARFGISRNNHEECVATFDRQSSGEYGTAPVASTVSARDYKGPTDLVFSLQGAGSTSKSANGSGWNKDISFTLNATDVHGVAQQISLATHDVAGTMLSRNTSGGFSNSVDHAAAGYMAIQSMAVRRLTPVECERLQGFPDNYTNIPWRKAKESPDGPRYKALGNSWAVPVVRWIGERIARSLG